MTSETLNVLRGPTHYVSYNGDRVAPGYTPADPPLQVWERVCGGYSWPRLNDVRSTLKDNDVHRDSEIAFEVYDDEGDE